MCQDVFWEHTWGRVANEIYGHLLSWLENHLLQTWVGHRCLSGLVLGFGTAAVGRALWNSDGKAWARMSLLTHRRVSLLQFPFQ